MKKFIVVPAAAALLLFLAGCGNKAPEQSQNQSQNNQINASQVQEEKTVNANVPEDSSFSGTMKDLLGMNKSQKCEVTYTEESFRGSNTTYVSGEKARADIVTNIANHQHQSHMIVKDDWTYMWSEGNNKGSKFDNNEFKKSIENLDGENPDTIKSPPSAGDINQKMDFKCSPWIADESMFTLPTGVIFTDETQLMNQSQAQPGSAQQDLCAMCDNLPDATAKAQCRKNCGSAPQPE